MKPITRQQWTNTTIAYKATGTGLPFEAYYKSLEFEVSGLDALTILIPSRNVLFKVGAVWFDDSPVRKES